MYNLKSIALNIRKLRTNKRYSAGYMSTKLKISEDTYHQIENGCETLTLMMFLNIAELLEQRPADLISFDPKILVFKHEFSLN